jgi:release factor glutamine methyltransferase
LIETAAGVRASDVVLLESPDDDLRALALEMAHRRAAGEPLQYVTGIAGFRRLDLHVGPGVFIPRPETETVAEIAMSFLPSMGLAVDIGAGSGAIALSIADERPDARVLATEISDEAIEWLTYNVAETGLQVDVMRGDLFSPLPEQLRGRVDVIVSNPPYVPKDDAHLLPVDVGAHEPPVALFAGQTGLDVLIRLTAESHEWLSDRGALVMEIGDRQDKVVTALLRDAGYVDVEVRPDLAERPRIAIARHG